MSDAVFIPFDKRLYAAKPEIFLIHEIEEELGSIPALVQKFDNNQWLIGDLVTLVHILLQSAGRTVDYRDLGNSLLTEGLHLYSGVVVDFLNLCLKKRRITAYSFRKNVA